jgi:hypothetical protein
MLDYSCVHCLLQFSAFSGIFGGLHPARPLPPPPPPPKESISTYLVTPRGREQRTDGQDNRAAEGRGGAGEEGTGGGGVKGRGILKGEERKKGEETGDKRRGG